MHATRRYGEDRIKVLQYLYVCSHPETAKTISVALNLPYNTVFQNLKRSVKDGIVMKDLAHRYSFISESIPTLERHLPTYVLQHGRSVTLLRCHRVGLRLSSFGLLGKVFVRDGLRDEGLRGVCGLRGVGVDLRFHSSSVYFQRSSVPVPFRSLGVFFEEFLNEVDFHTRGLADVGFLRASDLEVGVSVPIKHGSHLWMGPIDRCSRVEIYPDKNSSEFMLKIHALLRDTNIKYPLDPYEEGIQAANYIDILETIKEACATIQQQLLKTYLPHIHQTKNPQQTLENLSHG